MCIRDRYVSIGLWIILTMDKFYGESAPLTRTVSNGLVIFLVITWTQTTLNILDGPLRLQLQKIMENSMVWSWRAEDWYKVNEIAKTTGISNERVHHILYKHLHMRKLSARWVPRLLTIDQKREWIYKHSLGLFQRNREEVLRRFITVHET